jgi:hypothetical protein
MQDEDWWGLLQLGLQLTINLRHLIATHACSKRTSGCSYILQLRSPAHVYRHDKWLHLAVRWTCVMRSVSGSALGR